MTRRLRHDHRGDLRPTHLLVPDRRSDTRSWNGTSGRCSNTQRLDVHASTLLPRGEAVHTGYAVVMRSGLSPRTLSPTGTLGLAAVLGLSMGAATSLLQAVLPEPWSALVNAASPWLAVAFIAGAFASTSGIAALAGATTCAGEVIGYYLAASARGLSSSESTVLFWILCGLVGGPILAVAGRACRGGNGLTRLAAAGVLATCFFVEALRYQFVLHYGSRAALFTVIGVAVLILRGLVRPTSQGKPTTVTSSRAALQP